MAGTVTPSFKLPHNGLARNPLGQPGDNILRHRPPYVPYSVTQAFQIRTTSQLPGAIRRFWRGVARYTGAPRLLSWTENGFDQAAPNDRQGPHTTRLNMLIADAGSAVLHSGGQLSRPMTRPMLTPSVAHAAPRVVTSGNVRNRPVLRVRIPSYGSRVPALNAAGPGTQQ